MRRTESHVSRATTSKDRLDYSYGGRDPQAVTARLSNGTTVEQYQYDRDGWLTAATPDPHGTNWQYGYDGDGHLVSASFDGSNATSLSFIYAPDGKRLAKRQSCATGSCTSWSDLYVDELELRGSEASQAGVPAYYNLQLGAVHAQLALRRSTGGVLERDAQADRYYFADYLGSTALVTAGDGQPVNGHGDAGRFDYDAYGKSTPIGMSTSNIKERYNGKELDETGLSYYGARYASSSLGRWGGRDPKALIDSDILSHSSQEANLFAFASNNPVRFIDPDGRFDGDASAYQAQIARTGAAGAGVAVRIAPTVIRAIALPLALVMVVATVLTWDTSKPYSERGGELQQHGPKPQSAGNGSAQPPQPPVVVAPVPAGGEPKPEKKEDPPTGIVYKRTDPKSGDEYIGKTKSPERYEARQKEHDRGLGVKHEYEVVGRANPGTELDVVEEDKIRELGLRKEGGKLVNKRHEMSEERYRAAGGQLDGP